MSHSGPQPAHILCKRLAWLSKLVEAMGLLTLVTILTSIGKLLEILTKFKFVFLRIFNDHFTFIYRSYLLHYWADINQWFLSLSLLILLEIHLFLGSLEQ